MLLTGFDPFDGGTLNPSWLVARALHGQRIAGHAVVAEQLPTVFGAAQAQLHALLQAHRPALVLCLGQAGGRAALSIERIAINVADARIPDNQGAQPVDEPVVPGAPAAYFAPRHGARHPHLAVGRRPAPAGHRPRRGRHPLKPGSGPGQRHTVLTLVLAAAVLV
ncbi:MAG TPA: hypothetical protein DCW87_03095 [Comamonadaceae bacterium]|nr:hypothetical protein [Comamonadaceae bacterium]